jgi:hypothetical protein
MNQPTPGDTCCPRAKSLVVAAMMALASLGALAQPSILQPGDALIASSANSPGSEGVANAIDGNPTKYLNFDTRTGGSPSGFIVTPSVGMTRVTGLAMQSANDGPERDPRVVTLEGSNDDEVTGFATGTWELIVQLDDIPAYTARFETQTFNFPNFKAYKHYRWTVLQTQTENTCCMQIAEVALLGSALPQDVTQPGDPLIASSANSPGSEGVANAIDGNPTKYLNFDTRTGGSPSGFVVSPAIGRTLVTGLTMQSANDGPERDPLVVVLEGSNDAEVTGFGTGTWEQITRLEDIPAYTARFQTQTFLFDNYKPYRHYRWTVLETQTSNTCCMQIAEVELLGTGAPQDVTQPGDPLIASSANSPGSEGVANAIDGNPTKYLNFDTRTGGSPSGFVVTPSVGATAVIGLTMQSANDAPERDPLVVVLEGSNDEEISSFASGTWEQVVRLENIPAYTARFQTQEFFFPNQKTYKHYRWTVLETQTSNTCCMQIAEVELLAVVATAPCDQARFVLQPVDTPVLDQAQATFFVGVNGPWPIQWYADGVRIPGANQATYTTPPVTSANANVVYTAEIVGCETSTPVKAVLFTPSATKSIGISFRGGGANGAPTLMNEEDIAGLHPQAYWINAANAGTGFVPDEAIDPPVLMVNSDNAASDITVDWTSSGTWGSGSGTASATARMLNGVVYANPGTEGTINFANVPAGNHAVIAYMVGIPLTFQDADYIIRGQATETYHVRVLNADEYNAAPGFYRGISKDPNNRSLATYVRFDNVRAQDGVITLAWNTLTTGFDRGAPVNAVQLILNATPAGAPPTIVTQPQPTVGPGGGRVQLTVHATGDNLTYQWRKNGRNLPDGGNVSGATTATLNLTNLSEEDIGIYNVAVFNPGGSVVSRNASVGVSQYNVSNALVGYWKFDETTGAVAANTGSGGVSGVVDGTSTWGAGRVGNALSFDGGSTFVVVSNYPAASRGISAAGWVNIPADTGTDVSIFRNAQGALGIGAGAGPGTPAGQFEIGLVQNTTDGIARLSGAIGAGPNIVRVTASSAFTFGSWQHIAMTADGAQLRLYVNGQEVAVTDYQGTINPPEIRYLSMGARLNVDIPNEILIPAPDPVNPNFLAGALDDLGLWTRALSAEEVQKIRAAGLLGQPLTSIVLEPPVTEAGELTVAAVGGNLTVTWTAGRLESAPAIEGPWAEVVGSTSPYTEAISGGAKYFRSVSP